MAAKLLICMDGRWRSLQELQAEGRSLRFAVLRNGYIKMLSRPPKASNVVAGEPLFYRNIKRPNKISGSGKNESVRNEKENINNEKNNERKIEKVKKKRISANANNLKISQDLEKVHILTNVDSSVEIASSRHSKGNMNQHKKAKKRDIGNLERKIKEVKKKGIRTKKFSDHDNLKTSQDLGKVNDRTNVDRSVESASSSHSEENIKQHNKNEKSDIGNLERKIKEVQKKVISTKNICDAEKLKTLQDLEKVNIPSNVDSSVESVSSSHSEELVIEITDTDVLLMRKLFLKTQVYKVDVDRFDKDKVYRQATLYRFHPVVQVERLLPRVHHQLTSGLRSRSGTDIQKKPARAGPASKSPGKISKPARRRPPVRFRKSSVPPGREYSSLEDHAIVSWLSASRDRERAVNGNRVWRELETQHARLTGQTRSWHSLRNRYLRYILPALSLLALSPSHAQRLRAAAATGEIKSRKKRRASILHKPAAAVETAHKRGHERAVRMRASTLSDESSSDGILHHEVRRPSIRPKKSSGPVKKPQAEKSKTESASSDDEVQTRGRESPPKTRSSHLKSPEKSTAVKSKRISQDSESDEVQSLSKTSNKKMEVRQRNSMKLRTRSPLKSIQMEKQNNLSDTDNTYRTRSPLKKRRKLFNPDA